MSPYGEGIDPIPYISAAYGLAVILLGGYATWIIAERRKLKALKVAAQYRPEQRR